jgi:hypothetical protein
MLQMIENKPIKIVETDRRVITDNLLDLVVSFSDGDLGEYASEINGCIIRCVAHNQLKIIEMRDGSDTDSKALQAGRQKHPLFD